jgi:hypothetical protein
MASTAYPISAPAAIVDTGDFLFAQTGDVLMNPTGSIYLNPLGGGVVNFSGSAIFNFVTTGSNQLMYSDATNQLRPLPTGTQNQVLQVVDANGNFSWQTLPGQGPLMSAFATGSVTAIPVDTWTVLDSTYANWSVSVPGGVSDPTFTTGTGLFAVSATGVYEICAGVAYTGNNRGSGNLTADATLPGRATRQLQIYNTGTSVVLQQTACQAEANNNNATEVHITNCKVSLIPGDQIVVRARHDSTSALALITGAPRRTFFSVSRVR